MANFKRRHRRRAGIKGCCGMCMLRKTDGRRNHRLLTQQEMASNCSEREQLRDLGVAQAWTTRTPGRW